MPKGFLLEGPAADDAADPDAERGGAGAAAHPATVAILAPPLAMASAVHGMVDVLSGVGRDFLVLTGRPPGPAAFRPVILSPDGRGFRGGNGVWIEPDGAYADLGTPDIAIVPDLLVGPNGAPDGFLTTTAKALRRWHDEGATVASVCAGALALAEAGLLDGGEATTHWALAGHLARRFPAVRVRADRVLCEAGEGSRVVTAGAAASWTDLLLYLIARRCGAEEAIRIAKVYLLQWQPHGQLPYAAMSRSTQHEDAAVADCQEWLADNYAHHAPVAAMADRAGLPERTLTRRFRKATGLAPLEYVHRLRVEEAKQALETTDEPVEEIARAVGYEDPAFFRRLFRRRTGLPPSAYRRRYRAFRQAARR